MSSLRALTFAMSTLTAPVPTPKSAPRRARCAACALATNVLVGMHPVLTQVPPISLRSTMATVWPAAVSRPASGGPAWPAPTTIASKRVSQSSCYSGKRESTEHRDGIFEQGDRQVMAVCGGQASARLVAAQGAEHGADGSRAERAPGVAPGGADDGARERAQQDPGTERRRRGAGRCLGLFVEEQFADRENT